MQPMPGKKGICEKFCNLSCHKTKPVYYISATNWTQVVTNKLYVCAYFTQLDSKLEDCDENEYGTENPEFNKSG